MLKINKIIFFIKKVGKCGEMWGFFCTFATKTIFIKYHTRN